MYGKIEKSNFRMIETELNCYKESKAYLEELREEIIEGSSYQEVAVQSGSISDVTGSKGIRLASSREILEVVRRLRAVDKVIEMLKNQRNPQIGEYKDKLRLLEMKYFEKRFTDNGIWEELNIDRATFYRWRKDIIRLVGSQLGWRV